MSEITARDHAEWAAWLEANHETEPEVWVVYWKKGSGKESIKWADAVEVALTVQPPTPVSDDLKARLKASPAAKENQRRVSRTRWDRWLAWLDGTEGRTRTRRLNMIIGALEAREYGPVDTAAQPKR